MTDTTPLPIITRRKYPTWWDDLRHAPINLLGPGQQIVATGAGRRKLFITTLVLSVSGQTVVSIVFGGSGASGPLFMGGTDEPRAMVIPLAHSPGACGTGSLIIGSTGDGISVGGFATFFTVEE